MRIDTRGSCLRKVNGGCGNVPGRPNTYYSPTASVRNFRCRDFVEHHSAQSLHQFAVQDWECVLPDLNVRSVSFKLATKGHFALRVPGIPQGELTLHFNSVLPPWLAPCFNPH